MRRLLGDLALLVVPALSFAQAPSPFPHARHARLFPLCSSCHQGIMGAAPANAFPPPALCADCHNGTVAPRVSWAPPVPKGPGLLVFSHQQHAATVKGATCESCHELSDSSAWMNVARAAPERCMSCHAQGRSAHLADATTCSTCHRPLTGATALSDATIAGLPKPASHARLDFVSTHGAAARGSAANCATCHARESCERCHVDGAREPAIRVLGTDARVARLVSGKAPVYPLPADHHGAQWVLSHGSVARAGIARCATCHARASCEACHIGGGGGAPEIWGEMPDAREATAPGVLLRHARGDGSGVHVHASGFARAHGAQAASGAEQCASCHVQRFCTDCHAGERVAHRYHAANFVATHAPQAYSRETDCSSCHSTEAFCRDCHRQTGLSAKGNLRSTVFHNAQPLWLVQHGRAARQDLSSCTTCHQQTYCMQCHSDLGSHISPHGPGFDAARMSRTNPRLCLYCHLKNPLAP